ncbi:SAM-dependent methyltransferase [Streptomyces sp. NPDC091280]|uniref:SAM-dependent methyltransferase n=1 Tax=Streptomyces sp. NPDC091280 TaxID=3365984 RepID=UPI0037FEF33B
MIKHFDTSVPNSARVWNFWMGGKDYYDADHRAGDAYRVIAPQIDTIVREARRFRVRAVTLLAAELGVRQFLDIGTGMPVDIGDRQSVNTDSRLPVADNTHEVAQRVAPAARIVYVDNDPNVINHIRALSIGTREGRVAAVNADLHAPDTVLAAAHDHLDFSQPVALMLMGVLGHVEDHAAATAIVRRLTADLPAGSYFVYSDRTDTDSALAKAQDNYNHIADVLPYVLRSPAQLATFHHGLTLLDPGIVSCPRWRPDPDTEAPAEIDIYGGVSLKQFGGTAQLTGLTVQAHSIPCPGTERTSA